LFDIHFSGHIYRNFSQLNISIKLAQNKVDCFFFAFCIQRSFDTSDRLLIQFDCFL